jgi:site-specific recombinase XerD
VFHDDSTPTARNAAQVRTQRLFFVPTASVFVSRGAEDLTDRKPVANIKRPKVETDTVSTGLSRDEVSALIASAAADSPLSLALVLLLGLNGLSLSEALGADVEGLTTERGTGC